MCQPQSTTFITFGGGEAPLYFVKLKLNETPQISNCQIRWAYLDQLRAKFSRDSGIVVVAYFPGRRQTGWCHILPLVHAAEHWHNGDVDS